MKALRQENWLKRKVKAEVANAKGKDKEIPDDLNTTHRTSSRVITLHDTNKASKYNP